MTLKKDRLVELITLLEELEDVFIVVDKDIPGLDNVTEHKINNTRDHSPISQSPSLPSECHLQKKKKS